eukprot:scaffold483_cov107-Isochrysis_galbana.AAC.10
MQDRHGHPVAQAPARLVRLIRPPTKNKTPRARGGQRWRPDSSSWSWRRSTWPRKKARSESALTAQTRAQRRCDCPPERSPASPPGLAMPSAGTA